jgi:hypothetical protein
MSTEKRVNIGDDWYGVVVQDATQVYLTESWRRHS